MKRTAVEGADMEYRKLPRGAENEKFSVLGLGMGSITNTPDREIEAMVSKAVDSGINYFDLCGGVEKVYAPFGRAIRGRREQVFFQLHFGAVYNKKAEYGWSRDLEQIKSTVNKELDVIGTDYIDFGFLHCVDEKSDLRKLTEGGVYDYLLELKKRGVVRHIGFSSHTPEVAAAILDLNIADMMMFSINAAYDYELGDSWGKGSVSQRAELFRRCEAEQVGISVMKPFHGGKLLNAKHSPFRAALTQTQCLQYALDRPGVLTVLPGATSLEELDVLLKYPLASDKERDYSELGRYTADKVSGNCVYCRHCQPCPAGIDIGLVNKYYDLASMGDRLAAEHYKKLEIKADACIKCGRCDGRCPFGVVQSERMSGIAEYFG